MLEIEILKLHGSLNFPNRTQMVVDVEADPMLAVSDPYILPPIFNKMSSDSPGSMWQRALEHLNEAKNIIIVGYSLPRTDIYMQYFLKAGLGPNTGLRRIFVFDPVLYSEKNLKPARAMKKRYESCFAPQLRKHIHFNRNHECMQFLAPEHFGTTQHFVSQIRDDPESILFSSK
jgi:hypothetical protein